MHTAGKIAICLYRRVQRWADSPGIQIQIATDKIQASNSPDCGRLSSVVTVAEKGLPREQQVAQITRTLTGVARELMVPVIALSQLNRQVENRSGPPDSELAGVGAIEQDADLVLFLHKDQRASGGDGYESIAQQCMPIDLYIAKHRNAPTWICNLLFVKKKTILKPFIDRM